MIKITSNPYQKKTIFQSYDANCGEWRDINSANNANSGLLNEALCSGFFPFKVKQIVDTIFSEYYISSEILKIEFQGTDDEYKELESICESPEYADKIELFCSEKKLENARDILPDIIKVFKKLQPLVAESVNDTTKTKRELERFSDASGDIIPICVIGNYSSGKSTFINSLIGYELLPSSDEPTTAKIKINFLNYISSDTENAVENLRYLVYDFLSAEVAIENSAKYDNIEEWVNSVTEDLYPSVKKFKLIDKEDVVL